MKQYRIPHTDLDVSALCFGTGAFGTSVKGQTADELVSDFVAAGGNFFDTAHCYAFWEKNGLGASEREIAACLKRLGFFDQCVVATKGGHPTAGSEYIRPDDFLAASVLASDIEDSLERLAVDHIDLYYLHRDDGKTPVETIIDRLNEEIRRGRLRYVGASNWSIPRLAAANAYAAKNGLQGFVISQDQWSLAQPNWPPAPDPVNRFVGEEEIAWHAESGVPMAPYTATAGGFFATESPEPGAYNGPVNRGRWERARELSQQLDCTPTQIALAYLMNQKSPVFPIFSTGNRQHLAEVIGSVDISLTPEQVLWLRDG